MTNTLYITERTIAMSLKTPLLFAGVIIAIAVLAVFDIVPEEFAQFSVIALPAVVSIFASGACNRTGKGCA